MRSDDYTVKGEMREIYEAVERVYGELDPTRGLGIDIFDGESHNSLSLPMLLDEVECVSRLHLNFYLHGLRVAPIEVSSLTLNKIDENDYSGLAFLFDSKLGSQPQVDFTLKTLYGNRSLGYNLKNGDNLLINVNRDKILGVLEQCITESFELPHEKIREVSRASF